MNFMEKMINEREARSKSPRFKAEMAKEKTEFKDILNNLGKNTFEAGTKTLLKAPFELFSKSLKAIYNEKYGAEALGKDVGKIFFGKDGVFHGLIKVTGNVIHLSGKAIKIGLRELFAI